MEPIKLKVNPLAWVVFFFAFFAATSVLLFYLYESLGIKFILIVAFTISFIVIIANVGIFYTFQKEVILTDSEIKKRGFPSISIAYSDIQKIQVGSGGFSIYDKGKSPISITSMYSNFKEAKELFNQKIGDRSGIEIKGRKFFINRHLNQ